MGTCIERRALRIAGVAIAALLLLGPIAAHGGATRADAEVAALLARPLTAEAAVRIA